MFGFSFRRFFFGPGYSLSLQRVRRAATLGEDRGRCEEVKHKFVLCSQRRAGTSNAAAWYTFKLLAKVEALRRRVSAGRRSVRRAGVERTTKRLGEPAAAGRPRIVQRNAKK